MLAFYENRRLLSISMLFIVLCNNVELTMPVSLEEDLTLTYSQKMKLDEFKASVIDIVPHEYMKEDIYLIKWLRAGNYDIATAEMKLLDNLQWRKKNNMDNIIWEDFYALENILPYYLEGCDRERRPIASVYIGEWDARKAAVSGQTDRYIRYGFKLLEEITTLVREGQKRGRNITQYSILLDMKHFSLQQIACPQCIPVYTTLITGYEEKYPGTVHKVFIVNAPQSYLEFLALFRPLLSPALKRSLFVYGLNKKEWQPQLFKEISRDQLTDNFGGLKEFPITPHELRTLQQYPC